MRRPDTESQELPDVGELALRARAPRQLPELPEHYRDNFLRYSDRLRPRVFAQRWQPRSDPKVFGAAFAVLLYKGDRVLVRAALRRGEAGRPPHLSRVAVEYLERPDLEVTGLLMRDIPFASIRRAALEYLPGAALAYEVMSKSGGWGVTREAAAAWRKAADAALIGSDEHLCYITTRYLALVAEGMRADLLNALAEEETERLGEPIKRERVRGWLREATKRKFLSEGQRGTASGRTAGPNLMPMPFYESRQEETPDA